MFPYAIDLENISFSYENHMIINNLSLKVKPGEHIGIVGGSGCGKSTLLKILAGLYPPDSGTITIAGAQFPEKIRKQIALVMQGNSLFPLSIRDNITCGHSIADEIVWAACQSASLTKWIAKLPNGKTVVHVTHHQETLDDSDTIYRMEGGSLTYLHKKATVREER